MANKHQLRVGDLVEVDNFHVERGRVFEIIEGKPKRYIVELTGGMDPGCRRTCCRNELKLSMRGPEVWRFVTA